MAETVDPTHELSIRQDFDRFKLRIDQLLTEMEEEARETERQTDAVLQMNAKSKSSAQLLLADIGVFSKEMEQLKKAMSDAQ